ncbi:MAG: RNA degradosome polyphosphate kinase [Rhodospirillales bacterium]|jgi:polyphosphate kinase|nr:RNA degradosome polyphosphate kinase [Rhodospirillales bacterium]MBT4007503.1 RNA degradosome polyphosphate kinase [Rhodospirillales bacterium]MBT5075701.1 RNA degradosome polyphosphate kinase [Rhodospirillales bacterium]MBT5113217.1 RNA degradosome polyphosphate kinase [Rhodospirillales bacterium]MBT5671850.1 RNA degradosome polyphosphate kinase [Rhodospirillales bacterium]
MTDKFASEKSSGLPLGPERFINRELSWLAFNRRVIEEAMNTAHPILERVRFLSISAKNINEFYMVRAAGLMAQQRGGHNHCADDGMTVQEQLAAISNASAIILEQQQGCWAILCDALREEGISVVSRGDITEPERVWLERYFMEQVFPVLTPTAIDPAQPFPFIPNLGLSLILELKALSLATGKGKANKTNGDDLEPVRALVPLASQLNRFIRIPGTATRFITLENLIILFLDRLFPGYQVIDQGVFRVVRDTELELEEKAEDLVRVMSTALERRRRGSVIRLTFMTPIALQLRGFIVSALDVSGAHVFDIDGLAGLADILELVDARPELQFKPYHSRFPERIEAFGGDAFAAIKAKDMIVHHPYESFDVVVQFLHQAADDPSVVSIKQSLYRTSRDSPIIGALIKTAEAGKSVTVMVELQARFDEEANIRWSRDLERAGAQVIFGSVNLKTHAKLSLITRREKSGLKSYAHFGTGNYHPVNARTYADLSLFTSDRALCRDAARLFNLMTGYARSEKFEKIAVSPVNLRETLMAHIDGEIDHARSGRPAAIWAKMNQLVDGDIIDALYRASNAGVKIDLVVRGICCLRPGIVGVSENIRVKSIVGRFLEHARIICFGAGAGLPSKDAKVFISSADWMPRNLNRRIETMVPLENPTVHAQVLDEIMAANLKDTVQSWSLGPDGGYQRLKPDTENTDGVPFSAHEYFMTNPSLSGRSTKGPTSSKILKSLIRKRK